MYGYKVFVKKLSSERNFKFTLLSLATHSLPRSLSALQKGLAIKLGIEKKNFLKIDFLFGIEQKKRNCLN